MRKTIPEKITFIFNSSISVEIQNTFEDGEEFGETMEVIPTFISDSINEKTIERGKKWAAASPTIQAPRVLTTEELSKCVDNYGTKYLKKDMVYNIKNQHWLNDYKDIVGDSYFIFENVPNPDYKDPETIELENKFNNVQIVELEYRGNGGRAYKIVINGKYYCDLREDVLLESMLSLGINKNGFLNGEYCWMKYGAHTKLIRIGSSLYNKIVNHKK